MNVFKKIGLATVAAIACVSMANAGVITGWNMGNVATDPGPYVLDENYQSTLFTDTAKTATNGFIGWTESDVLAPGMKVVTGDDQDGSNCIMTTGFNPGDGSDKMCTDDLKYSKRFKLKGELNAPMDITFNVAEGTTGPYKILHKYSDYTTVNWDEFTLELGFMVDGSFVKSTVGDGLGFSDSRGRVFSGSVTSYQSKADVLSGYFSQGLAGPADKYHPEPGYFDTTTRMSYGLIATEDDIVSDGISSNYSDLFGTWNTIYNAPTAYYWDDDNDPLTDDLLMANCQGEFVITDEVAETGYCAGQWVTYREYPGLENGVPGDSAGVPTPVPADMIAAWDIDTMYHTGAIEDLSNLGLTYWIKVDDTSSWPVQSFTMRFIPIPADAPVPVEVCTDGIDNDGDGAIDCMDNDCSADPICSPPTPEVCDDELDNDQDGMTDCADNVDCQLAANCQAPVSEICTDGIDNDGDSYADCADPDCAGIAGCGAEGKFDTCSDGFDNDGDGDVDCVDSGCSKNKACR